VTTPAEFYILAAVMHRPRHGYEILLDVQSIGQFRIGPATLYTTLKRLLARGLITEVSGPSGVDARRRYYRITPGGRAACAEEHKRMEQALRLLLRKPKTAN
jgi:DNA-binding PadR family transcriptional regulator